MKHAEWQAEWDRLVAERDDARARWRRATGALSERAHDPFGVRGAIRKHPLAAAAISAGAGALIGRLFGGGASRRRREVEEEDVGRDGAAPSSIWGETLRHVAVGVATPLLTSFLSTRLAEFLASHEESASAPAPTENGSSS